MYMDMKSLHQLLELKQSLQKAFEHCTEAGSLSVNKLFNFNLNSFLFEIDLNSLSSWSFQALGKECNGSLSEKCNLGNGTLKSR